MVSPELSPELSPVVQDVMCQVDLVALVLRGEGGIRRVLVAVGVGAFLTLIGVTAFLLQQYFAFTDRCNREAARPTESVIDRLLCLTEVPRVRRSTFLEAFFPGQWWEMGTTWTRSYYCSETAEAREVYGLLEGIADRELSDHGRSTVRRFEVTFSGPATLSASKERCEALHELELMFDTMSPHQEGWHHIRFLIACGHKASGQDGDMLLDEVIVDGATPEYIRRAAEVHRRDGWSFEDGMAGVWAVPQP